MTPGYHVAKGGEVGFFQCGGSAHCLVFRPGVIADFTLEALPQPHDTKAPPVLVRSKLATANTTLTTQPPVDKPDQTLEYATEPRVLGDLRQGGASDRALFWDAAVGSRECPLFGAGPPIGMRNHGGPDSDDRRQLRTNPSQDPANELPGCGGSRVRYLWFLPLRLVCRFLECVDEEPDELGRAGQGDRSGSVTQLAAPG